MNICLTLQWLHPDSQISIPFSVPAEIEESHALGWPRLGCGGLPARSSGNGHQHRQHHSHHSRRHRRDHRIVRHHWSPRIAGPAGQCGKCKWSGNRWRGGGHMLVYRPTARTWRPLSQHIHLAWTAFTARKTMISNQEFKLSKVDQLKIIIR